MLLATPVSFFLEKSSLLAANTAKESEGVTKKFLPKIMFLSASPSQAAPKSYFETYLVYYTPMRVHNYFAHLRLGSG